MKTYLEIKKLLVAIFNQEIFVEEENDVPLFEVIKYDDEKKGTSVVLQNSQLLEAYNLYTDCKKELMILYGDTSFEVAIQSEWMPIRHDSCIKLDDKENEISYYMGTPSLMYFIMLLDLMDEKDIRRSRISSNARMYIRRGFYHGDNQDVTFYLSKAFRIQTLAIKSSKKIRLSTFQSYAKSFEYLYMYRTRKAISEVESMDVIIPYESGGIARSMEMDEPPRRKIKAETLEYYTMALEARDPFTKYISFYHVIEYHFDEVYKKKIIEQMRDKITSPEFSYKSDKSIYELAKFANKKMKNDDRNGKGNELESLKYVLSEYVPVDDLIKGLDEFNPKYKDYYAEKAVSFAGSNAKITWNDQIGVYTTIANRVYDTRNSLVHTKSEQSEKQYKPQKHKEMLMKEIPLIQVIAENIIFSTSTVF